MIIHNQWTSLCKPL